MAEIRVTDEGGVIRDPEHLLPAHASAGEPGQIAAIDDPDTARAEIEQTRARMSSTIDQLESALLRKKEQIQDKLDVLAPVRERPLPAAALVFAGGLVLGYLTGGGDGGRDRDEDDGGRERGKRRRRERMELEGGADWEQRARRLMKTCNAQEEELRVMRERLMLAEGGDDGEHGMGVLRGAVHTVRDSLLGGLADAVSNAYHSLRHRGGDDGGARLEIVEVAAGDGLPGAYDGEPLADDYDGSHLRA
ncbi:MAG TPA: DUF3618 domain-containing protein [Longimicrobiaceae bacterium]|nr:DUF3618 domain-containing protein [Longimicrobiaceae bacterium]